MRSLSFDIALAALIAALYATTTTALGAFSYSWVQVRISEAITPLPFLFGFPAVAGLTLGCLIANWFSPIGFLDVFLGTTLTLLAGLLSWKCNFGKKLIASIYPVLINAFGVSAYVSMFYNVPYFLSVATIGIGEFIAATLIGYPLLALVERYTSGLRLKDKN